MERMTVFMSVSAVVLLLAGGMFFIFGEDVLQADFYEEVFSGDWIGSGNEDNNGDDGIASTGSSSSSDAGGSGGSVDSGGSGGSGGFVDSGGSGESEIVASPGCSMKQLPYSLRNFGENVSCQEWVGGDLWFLFDD